MESKENLMKELDSIKKKFNIIKASRAKDMKNRLLGSMYLGIVSIFLIIIAVFLFYPASFMPQRIMYILILLISLIAIIIMTIFNFKSFLNEFRRYRKLK